MTDEQKWDALHQTALSDHGPMCRYGQTNGREMCTCDVLVELLEGTYDGQLISAAQAAGVNAAIAAAKPDRMAAARRARARKVAERRREREDAAAARRDE